MTYQLNDRLFLENGPAIQASASRARRASLAAFYAAEKARLDAARTVSGAEFKFAA
jgi:hypothetical protein